MKYKRIKVSIPYTIYENWLENFHIYSKYGFKSYECIQNIDDIDFIVKFIGGGDFDDPKLLLRVYKKNEDKDTVLYYSSFNNKTALKMISSFEFKDIKYILKFDFEKLTVKEKVPYLKKIGNTSEILTNFLYSTDIYNSDEVMDAFYYILYLKFFIESSPYEEFINKLDTAKLFLNKLFYNGFEIYDYDSIRDINLLPTTTNEEIFQKEMEYVNFKLKHNDDNDSIRTEIRKKSDILYANYYTS